MVGDAAPYLPGRHEGQACDARRQCRSRSNCRRRSRWKSPRPSPSVKGQTASLVLQAGDPVERRAHHGAAPYRRRHPHRGDDRGRLLRRARQGLNQGSGTELRRGLRRLNTAAAFTPLSAGLGTQANSKLAEEPSRRCRSRGSCIEISGPCMRSAAGGGLPGCCRPPASPALPLLQVDWAAAAASLPAQGGAEAAAAFGSSQRWRDRKTLPRHRQEQRRSCRRSTSTPCASTPRAGKQAGRDKLDGQFWPVPSASKYFLPGPGGYTGTFTINSGEGGFQISYKKKPIDIEITGAGFIYELDGPDHQEVFPAKDLQDAFPGIKRVLHEAHAATSSSASACLTSSRSSATTAGRPRNSSPAARPIRSR